jgi:hypothetical protein
MKIFRQWFCLSALIVSACFVHANDASTNVFGFIGREIFPIENGISQLHVADMDGDGLNDIVIVNNARSRINILYNQTGKTNLTQKPKSIGTTDINELPPDARFRIESVASEKRIAAIVVADLNADGKPDIAYYGEPPELIVQYNQGSNTWSALRRFAIDDGQFTQNAMASGDLNGDGRADLVLLSERYIYFLSQNEDHTLSEPQKIPLSAPVKAVQVLDVDGDGKSDLLLVNWEDRYPFRFRLQKPNGELGPEIYFSMPPIRSYWADNLETNSKVQVMTIAQNSGRAQISQFESKRAEKLSGSFLKGQFNVLPLNKTDKARRGILWADVNGDGLADLLVAQPESGQLSISFQEKDGSLAAPKTFPTLSGVSELAVADWEGDGKPEIFVLSVSPQQGGEQQIGVTKLDEKGHLPFPTLVAFDGKPLAMAVGKLQPGGPTTLAVIVDKDGKRSLVTRTSDGKSKTQKLNENFQANPTTMVFHDIDQDGLQDLVALIQYEKVKVLRQVTGKDFEEIDIAPPGGSLEQPWLATADVDGDGKQELLLAQKNFLRAVALQSDSALQNSTNRGGWTFKVKDQINGSSSNSRIVGATAVPNGTNPAPSLFLLDAERKTLTFCERDTNGVWQVIRNIELPVSEFSSLRTVAFGGSTPNAVALIGLNNIAWQSLSGDTWELKELDGYESPIKDAHLNDVTSGDLNKDGRKDLVFLETARNYLDLVLFTADHKLLPANRWQVFEERTFRNRRSDMPEPREAAVADVTGDKKNDLIVLVHDRILVYPQE